MKIIDMLKNWKYFLLSLAIFLAFIFIYVIIQIGDFENFPFWINSLDYENILTLLIFQIIFSISVAYQIYIRKQPKVCKNIKKGAVSSSASGLGILLVSQCAACAQIGFLILPASLSLALAGYSVLINLVGIGILLFMINYLGGFK